MDTANLESVEFLKGPRPRCCQAEGASGRRDQLRDQATADGTSPGTKRDFFPTTRLSSFPQAITAPAAAPNVQEVGTTGSTSARVHRSTVSSTIPTTKTLDGLGPVELPHLGQPQDLGRQSNTRKTGRRPIWGVPPWVSDSVQRARMPTTGIVVRQGYISNYNGTHLGTGHDR